MDDYVAGYPIDLRTPQQRTRDGRSTTGDFEYAAARVMARLLGDRVYLQDDNRQQAMPDVRIEHANGTAAYGEITMDIEAPYSAMLTEIRRRAAIQANVGRYWWVTINGNAKVKMLEQILPDALRALEASGDVFLIVVADQHLDTHANPTVRRLAAAGVVELASRPLWDGETGTIQLCPQGTGGPGELDWTVFGDWLTTWLTDPRRDGKRAKLMGTGADERHLFAGLSYTTPWPVFYALDNDNWRQIPDRDPTLPAEITHLWMWNYPTGRCIAWFPDRGWFEPMFHWSAA